MRTSFDSDKAYIKALILAGGRGKRLGEHTQEINKAVLKFGNKYLIEFSLENAVALGVKEIVILVGYMRDLVMRAVGDSYRGIPVQYATQPEQKGVVHAMEYCKELIGDADFILQLADEFFVESQHLEFYRFFMAEQAFAVCGIVHVRDAARIRKTYSVEADPATKQIVRLIEKPAQPMNDIMGTGNILFRNNIFRYIASTPVNPIRGEKELPDLIQTSINDGKKVLYFPLAISYININTVDDLQELASFPRPRVGSKVS